MTTYDESYSFSNIVVIRLSYLPNSNEANVCTAIYEYEIEIDDF